MSSGFSTVTNTAQPELSDEASRPPNGRIAAVQWHLSGREEAIRFVVEGQIYDVTECSPRYNAAPSQGQYTILHAEPQVVTVSRWGFVPEWADGRNTAAFVIHCTGEGNYHCSTGIEEPQNSGALLTRCARYTEQL
jgi:hypothetical protein